MKLKFDEITEYLLLVLSKAEKKRATKTLIIVALKLAAEKLTKDKKTWCLRLKDIFKGKSSQCISRPDI